MSVPPLQRNVELFSEGNQCLAALLGGVSFERRLEELLRKAEPARVQKRRRQRRADRELVLALLGALSVGRSIRCAALALASGPSRESDCPLPAESVPPSLRELLR